MASPQEKLAESLAVLKDLQDSGAVAVRSRDLPRTHRERLVKNGFLQEVMKGWYVASDPTQQAGDTTPWYSSFWKFCADYLHDRFGEDWCLSPEQSICIHVGNQTVPQQLQVRSSRASNKPTQLLHGTSIFDVRLKQPELSVIRDQLRVFDLPQALIEAVPKFFTVHPTDARAALATFSDASSLLQLLLDGGHSKIAGRLCGAFRNIGRDRLADDILNTMKAAGYDVRETDPFEEQVEVQLPQRSVSPYAGRIQLMWQQMRKAVISHFPLSVAVAVDPSDYLRQVDETFVSDAYHSLSIEGYRVSRELIERVHRGDWHPEQNESDRQQQDALAARGYYQAFQAVKESVRAVLVDDVEVVPGEVARRDHGGWYREMFGPLVTAGFLQAGSLAGYRSSRVYLRGSRHVPVSGEVVSDVMPVFFDLLAAEEHPAVRVVLGHFVFVYIHPYMDGNGRMGRFMMNVMMAAGGYPWTVVPMDRRAEYMEALEAASVEQDIVPFARFLSSVVQEAARGES